MRMHPSDFSSQGGSRKASVKTDVDADAYALDLEYPECLSRAVHAAFVDVRIGQVDLFVVAHDPLRTGQDVGNEHLPFLPEGHAEGGVKLRPPRRLEERPAFAAPEIQRRFPGEAFAGVARQAQLGKQDQPRPLRPGLLDPCQVVDDVLTGKPRTIAVRNDRDPHHEPWNPPPSGILVSCPRNTLAQATDLLED